MKKIALLVITVCFTASLGYSQKAKVQTAWNFYKEPYQQYDKAKEAIDEALTNEQTSGMAKTWYYKGLIYAALYGSEKYKNLCDNCLWTAYEAFSKANQLDPKNEWVDDINFRISLIVRSVFDEGVKSYQAKDFKSALGSFEKVLIMSPADTAVILNSAYSAERAGDKQKAIQYYEQLIGYKYRDINIYLSLADIYKNQKENDKALATIRNGRAQYPDTLSLLLTEINILLAQGKSKDALGSMEAAIAKDPTNTSLYLAQGSTYDNLAHPSDEAARTALKPEQKTEYSEKAVTAYKNGLKVNPNDFNLNYYLGAMYFNEAAEMVSVANGLKSNADYEKAKVKFDAKFKESEPYLEKALETNPKSSAEDKDTYKSTLVSLKQLYLKTGETEKYKKVDDLSKAE
jgi:tetratricopeptide (TPR) repeat protein